jgi:hypothetical protein
MYHCAAILKIFKTKSTTMSDDLFLCQVSNGSAAPWLPWQRPPFWFFFTPIAATHYGGYSYKASWSYFGQHLVSKYISLMKIDNRPRFWNWDTCYDPSDHIISCYYYSFFFLSSVKSLSDTFLGDSIFFLAYLIPLNVDVVAIKFHQFLFGE